MWDKKLIKLPKQSRHLAIKIVLTYFYYWLLQRILPFNKIIDKQILNKENDHTSISYTLNELKYIRLLKVIGNRVNSRFPIKFKCLTQVLALSKILQNKKIKHTVYLGVRKQNQLEAHAWLNCGDINVTGGKNHDFIMVGFFYYHF